MTELLLGVKLVCGDVSKMIDRVNKHNFLTREAKEEVIIELKKAVKKDCVLENPLF